MSDDRTGLPHDLPEYTPNWPVPIKVRAKVFKSNGGAWLWAHSCPHRLGVALGFPSTCQAAAFEAALKHARGCW